MMHKANCDAYARWHWSEVMGSGLASAYTKSSAAILELKESSAFMGCVVFAAVPSGLLFMIGLAHLLTGWKAGSLDVHLLHGQQPRFVSIDAGSSVVTGSKAANCCQEDLWLLKSVLELWKHETGFVLAETDDKFALT